MLDQFISNSYLNYIENLLDRIHDLDNQLDITMLELLSRQGEYSIDIAEKSLEDVNKNLNH